MKPVLYRYKDTESVIKVMDGYTPGDGWEPLYSHDQVDQLQAQLVRQQKSYEAEIKVESEERLQNCAALVAENEQLRWAVKDALAQLQRGDFADAESTLSVTAMKGTP